MVVLVLAATLPAAATAPVVPARNACTIVGTPGPDILVGTPGRDVICGLGGDDRIYGRGGDDVISGGPGNDVIDGGPGDDVIWGSGGDDVLRGGGGDDRLYGGRGDDVLRGGTGDDVLRGGPGDDRLYGGRGADILRGGRGNDRLDGGPGPDRLGCGPGADTVVTTQGDKTNGSCADRTDPQPPPRQPGAPVAVPDTVGTDEDTLLELPVSGPGSPAANDTDPDGDPLTVIAVVNPVGGTVEIVGTVIRFDPTPDLCGPGAGGFDYTVADGTGRTDVGRVTVDIACLPDDPTADDDTATVDEDAPATAIDVLANDADADGDPLVIGAVTQPAHGTVVVTGGGSGLTYEPDPDYCNTPPGTDPDTFTYTLTPGGATATVTVAVTCVDDAPVAVDDTATVTEDDPATAIDVLANDTDADGDPFTIGAVTQPAHGTVVITGGGTGLTYVPDPDYCNTPPGTDPDTFTYTLSPGGAEATVAVAVTCVDDAPVAVDDTATVTEDDPATAIDVLANDSDADGDPLVIGAVTQSAHGTVVITGGGTGLTYEPDPDYCNTPPGTDPDVFTYTLAGGPSATVAVAVTCVEDLSEAVDDHATTDEDTSVIIVVLANDVIGDTPPSVTAVTHPAHGTATTNGATVTYEPDADYCNTPPGTDPDSFTYTITGGSTATVTVAVTCVADDPVAVDDSATLTEDDDATAIDVLANDRDPDGVGLAITAATQPANGTVVITGGGTGLTYRPDADYCNDPPALPDTFDYTITGGSTATVSVAVTCVIDPAVAHADSASTIEDVAVTIDVLANDTLGDVSPVVTLLGQPAHGTTSMTGTQVRYVPDADYCNDPPGTTLDNFVYTITGGSSATVTVTVTCVNDAPVAADATFTGASGAVGNTVLVVDDATDAAPAVAGPHKTVTGDLLAGASDVETPGSLAVVAATTGTTQGGSVTLQEDGDFVYTPPAGCTVASDTFAYTVTDQDPAGALTGTGTVTVQISGCVWYVANDATGDDAGTSSEPFATLAQAAAASAAGQTIHVAGGDGTTTGYTTGITLKTGQRLVGAAADLVVGGSTLATGAPGARPVLTATMGDVVTLASGATVTGVRLDPSGASSAIAGGSGVSSGVLADVRIIDTGAAGTKPGINLASTTGTFTVTDLAVDNTAASGTTDGSVGVQLSSAGAVLFDPAGTIRLDVKGAKALAATGTALTGSVLDTVSVTGSASGGISLVNTTGAVTFTDLALQTTGGTAFALQGTGAVTVPSSGTATIAAANGPAVDIATAANPALSFDSVSSTNSTTRGIRLSGLGSGSFSGGSGSITGHAQGAFVVEGGSGAITYDGTIGDGPGRSLEVSGRTGGTVAITQPIADAAGAGGGLVVSGNSGGSTLLSGQGTTLSTGTADAVVFTANGTGAGHTLGLTGGGLVITTSIGRGIEANGGGTLAVTGAGNRITSGTGRALGVSATRIDAAGLVFERISAAGAPNGIVLAGTGDAGSLQVTGSGGTCAAGSTAGCSGGVITASAGGDDAGTAPVGTGIVLTDTKAPSLTRMWVHDATNYGIRGDRTRGLTLTHSVVDGTLGTTTATPYDDSAVLLTNLSGTASITDTAIAGGLEDSLRVSNTNTDLQRLTLTRVAFTRNGASPQNDAIALESSGTGSFPVTVASSSVQGAAGDVLQYSHTASGAGDLVLTGNTFANDHPAIATGGGGVTIYQDGAAGSTTMDITGNTFRGAVGAGVLVAKGQGAAHQTGSFGDNDLGAAGVPDSGSVSGSALKLQQLGGGSLAWTVTGNRIRGYNNYGIEVLAGGGGVTQSGSVSTVVTGNTITEPGNAPGTGALPKQGVHYNIGTFPGDSFDVCADVRGNVLDASGAVVYPANGLVTDVVLRQRQNTTIRVPGLVGTGTAAVQSWIAAQNPTGPPVVHASASGTGGGFVATGCPTP
ncbi:hypothetical protein GCM10009788_53120 [Nocardioides humi]|uniref:Tandem-95 repeat protein n=1 Tax=Nocardioides humi TaxID=449461 RepID=A0ABN2BQH3_9ACTN